jgi:predicted DNA-binding transcriptional regulator YafY
MSQIERIYWLDAQIRAERFPSIARIREQFGVSERTAKNDITHLRNRLWAPVKFDRSRGGYAYTDATFAVPFLALSAREADALRGTLLTARAYLPPTDAAIVQHLAVKLSPYIRGLPDRGGGADSGGEMAAGQIELTSDAPISEALLADIRRAHEDRHRLRITYFSAHRGESTDRVVHPYLLLNWRGELYLVAYCESRQSLRDFFLPRIKRHELLPQPGAEDVPVRVRFSPSQARWIRERRYHPSQQTEEQPDGGLILTLRVSGLAEVKRWLLGFGAEAEVLEPAALRDDLRTEAEKIQKKYQA